MGYGNGLGSQFGWARELSYGTALTPTTFVKFNSWDLSKKATRVQGMGIQKDIDGASLNQWVTTATGATGKLDCDFQTLGMGLLLETLMGTTIGTPTAVVGSTGAYKQLHTLASPAGKSLTFQGSLPARTAAGDLTVANLAGGKITGADFSCSVDGILKSTWDIDGKSYNNDSPALGSASWITGTNIFHGGQLVVKTGTHHAEGTGMTAISGVTNVGVSIKRSLSTDVYYASANGGLKEEPLLNSFSEVSATIDQDFINTTFHTMAAAGTSTGLRFEWTGAQIGSTASNYKLVIAIPSVVIEDAAGQSVSGPETLKRSWTFKWLFDGTNKPFIEYINSEATLT